MAKEPIILTDQIVPPRALVRAGLETLPTIIRAQGECVSRRFIKFFTATIRNRNTRMEYARAVKRFFDFSGIYRRGLLPFVACNGRETVTKCEWFLTSWRSCRWSHLRIRNSGRASPAR